ncbi:SCL-interrupting locus protein homolog [Polyodon spathula]|uniref:SCL-interrupting locus protein homolog n=1 Tax=Polyodon spathula TaxID=7913 RepID=UPI001B7E98BF|nr:SCL-interrupting locus protein homolog [Polyodon spathula]
MSVQVNLKNIPSHLMESAYNNTDHQRSPRSAENMLTPISFPKTKIALWDPAPVGDMISLHLSYYRNPRLLVMEKTLRLAHRHARQSNRNDFSCFLLGSMEVDDDEEGVTLTVDRFDPGREIPESPGKVPTALLPGDFLIPCTVNTGPASGDTIVHSAEDFLIAFKILQQHCCSKETLDPSKLLTMRARLTCAEHMDNLNFNLHWAAVTIANTLDATPVKPVPIIPTALARNLTSPMNIAQVQGVCKFGFLTMDQTRKLLLVLESDPKAYTLPLVGIWLSGITHIHSPRVWACCLRYLFSSSLQDRVVSEGGGFLIVLYSLTHKEPEFYECRLCTRQQELGFQLLTSTESLSLFKNVNPSDRQPTQFELSAESQNQETDFFKEVSARMSFTSSRVNSPPNKLSVSDHDSGVEDEDFSPRPSPSPHPASQQIHRIHPSVPELSIVFEGSFIDSNKAAQCPQGFGIRPSLASAPQQYMRSTGPLQKLQPEARQPSIGSCSGSSPVRCAPTPANQPMKVCKGRVSPAHSQPVNWKGGPPLRKSSVSSASSTSSSSSSSSTPHSGQSPNTSIHQPKGHLPSATKRGISPAGRPGAPSTQRPPSPGNPPARRGLPHSAQTPARTSNFHMPFSAPHSLNQHPASFCSCCQHRGHLPYYPVNSWQGVPNFASSGSPVYCPSDTPAHDCSFSPFHQGMGSQSNGHCSPMCQINGQGSHGGTGSSAHNSALPVPGELNTQKTSPSKGQFCLSQAAYVPQPISQAPAEIGLMGLPPDAYKILVEQDKKLKVLQAQIQKLLEAQSNPPCSHTSPPQSGRQVESAATETQTAVGVQVKKSVSIAVGTGASLFWSPTVGQEEVAILESQDNEMGISLTTEEDTTRDSMASSLKAVDIHSFAESTQVIAEESVVSDTARQVCIFPFCFIFSSSHRFWNERGPQVTFQSSELGESVSMCIQSSPAEDAKKQENEKVNYQLNSELQNEQKFYQDLLGQVNSRLQASSSGDEEEPGQRQAMHPETGAMDSSSVSQSSSWKKQSAPSNSDKDRVRNATLKQLEHLGVKVDPDCCVKGNKTKSQLESARTRPCIYPQAVLPRLNYMSFGNMAMSGFGPSGVDLSLEANAIALKYLNDSQLSQLSVSRGGRQTGQEESQSLSIILQHNTTSEKTMMGMSLMSPNNMSFATRKYMKRYGLIECEDSSEEEEEGASESQIETTYRKDYVERGTERQQELLQQQPHRNSGARVCNDWERNILKNITNEIPSQQQHLSDQDSQQMLRDLKPKMKPLAGVTHIPHTPDKENGMQFFPDKLMHDSPVTHKHMESQGSVENFLDVSRLRQLPKLF